MEAFKEAIAAAEEQSNILKGKRTKRKRPQSPIPFYISPRIASSSPPPDRADEEEEATEIGKDGVNNVITSSSSSASWSSNNNPTLNTEDQDQDEEIANCLILLSQGEALPHHQHQELKLPYNNNNIRFISRRFLETSSSNGGVKEGYYVYQCKTCDRTFPSFQALGGHRASHKKPKTTSFYSNLEVKKNIFQNDVTYKNNHHNNNKSLVIYGKGSKVHECGICGAEFTSGQALGGHMRRHRGTVVVPAAPITVAVALAAANTELSLSPMSSFDQISDGHQDHNMVVMPERKIAKVVSLDLDLNLPAAPEDENRVNGFSFASKQKQEQEHMKQREEPKSLVLSSPTLVDCHY